MNYNQFKFKELNLSQMFKDYSHIIGCISYENRELSVFEDISNFFYRENFHSDLLAYYFSFNDTKKVLIQWINNSIKKEDNIIDYKDYIDSEKPSREEKRRDITIYSKDKTHAIIIENKSNDFSDRPKQLIRYYSELKKNNITVDAILYLNKYSIKNPDYSNWTQKEIKIIEGLLLKTQLIGSNSITDEVFNKVINQSNNKRVVGISIELKSLFNNIINGDKIMADKDISDFLKIMNDQQKRQDLEKLVDAYNCLPALMREHYKIYLEEQREKLPKLEKIGQHKDICLYVDFKYKKKTYYIDFWFYHNQISIYLGARDYDNWKKQLNALKKDMTSDWLFGDIPTDDLPMIIFSDVYNEKEVQNEILRIINSFSGYIDE